MKRRLTKLVLFLLLGAIVNVAVAWGLNITSGIGPPTPLGQSDRITEYHRHLWRKHAPSGFAALPDWFNLDVRRIGYELINLQAEREDLTYDAFEYGNLWWVGWPVKSLRAAVFRRQANNGEVTSAEHREAILEITLGKRIGGEDSVVWFPYRPIWPGFAINTIFYAALLWLLTLVPFTARRMIRRRRGRCIKCGYDLRGAKHEVCPECGAGDDGV